MLQVPHDNHYTYATKKPRRSPPRLDPCSGTSDSNGRSCLTARDLSETADFLAELVSLGGAPSGSPFRLGKPGSIFWRAPLATDQDLSGGKCERAHQGGKGARANKHTP